MDNKLSTQNLLDMIGKYKQALANANEQVLIYQVKIDELAADYNKLKKEIAELKEEIIDLQDSNVMRDELRTE